MYSVMSAVPPAPPLPTKEDRLKRQIHFLNQRMTTEKKQCLSELDFLKGENKLLLQRIQVLVAENNLLRQQAPPVPASDTTSKNIHF